MSRRLKTAMLVLVAVAASPVWAVDGGAVSISDIRSPESLEGHRDSNFSAIAFLPEKAVKPSSLEQLHDAIANRAVAPVTGEVSELHIVDYFPKRIKAGPGGWLSDAIMKSLVNSRTDWSFVANAGISNEEDSVICLLAGTFNGVPVRVEAHEPYKLGAFSAMVRSDKHFKAAVSNCIDQAAAQVLAKLAAEPSR